MSSPPTPTQLQLLKIIPRITGSMSILGSGYIMGDILWRRRKQQSRIKVTDRLLIGMSVCDILASVSTPLVLDKALPEPMGPGNQATCDAQGFFSQFVTATALYTGWLALTYLLSIQLGWKEARLRPVERIGHFLILLFVLISGGLSIHWELYNPTPFGCTMTSSPRGCGADTGIPCERGESAFLWRLPFRTIPEYTVVTFSTIVMMVIYCHVRKMELRSNRWTFEQSVNNFRTDSNGTARTALAAEESKESKEVQPEAQESAVQESQQDTKPEDANPTTQSTPTDQEPEKEIDLPDMENPREKAEQSTRSNNSSSRRITFSTIPSSPDTGHSSSRPRRPVRSMSSIASSSSVASLGMSREVGIQGMCFILAFLLTWTVPTIARCLNRFGNHPLGMEWFIAIQFFLPLQGFFNFLVYLRPKLRKTKLWGGHKSSSAPSSTDGQ